MADYQIKVDVRNTHPKRLYRWGQFGMWLSFCHRASEYLCRKGRYNNKGGLQMKIREIVTITSLILAIITISTTTTASSCTIRATTRLRATPPRTTTTASSCTLRATTRSQGIPPRTTTTASTCTVRATTTRLRTTPLTRTTTAASGCNIRAPTRLRATTPRTTGTDLPVPFEQLQHACEQHR